MRRPLPIPLVVLALGILCPVLAVPANGVSSSNAVSRAIEQTKQRQAAHPKGGAPATIVRQTQRTLRVEAIDVEALNALIKSFDKTWISPKLGAKEPTGSNFQYKKTCASIYKARHGACSQLGFGSMCFNYCYEKGETVQYACVDASDAAYCKSSSNFDAFLSKYRKDAYKAKAYVHQMISRCFNTAICNSGTGILNSTHVEATSPISTRKPSHLKLTRPPGATRKAKSTSTTTTTTTEAPTTTQKRAIPLWQKLLKSTSTTEATPEESAEEETTTKKKIVIEEKKEISEEEEEEEDKDKEEVEALPEETTTSTTTTVSITPSTTTPIMTAPSTTPSTTTSTTSSPPIRRITWKSLTVSTPPPFGPELSRKNEKIEDGFWNRFQPNRWYQSIHYFTNTGR